MRRRLIASRDAWAITLGRRGVILRLLGIMWVLVGVSVLVAPHAPEYLLLDVAPGWRAAMWIIAGAIALGFAGRDQGEDKWGFAALYLPAAYRWLAYLYGVIDYFDDTHGRVGDLRAMVGVLSWGVILIVIRVIAGWPDPIDVEGDTR